MSEQAARKPRADSARNRVRVLQVACDLFAERGDEVQMAEVAQAAGVGVGTVYRHFPTRQALVDAVAERRFAEILAFARTRCLPDPDARRALACFLSRIGTVHEQGRGLSEAIEKALGSTEPRGEVGAELLALTGALLERGQADGAFRADATVADLYMIAGAVAAISRHTFGDWRRFIDLALDGLRPR
ncbi:TetR/AcrR family transcriptional regulator [Actinomadura rugatobispora]|uniref:TetR/AcrR family transcriptional regulator n=1 Tax=Actinomadura rugatobispora TaxID=1994 RepID=A0ABW1AE96_9ACTN|nr:TetR family transcriptional regulator [Actinomadura rugatobispora]